MASLDPDLNHLRKLDRAIFWLEAIRDLVVLAAFLSAIAVWVA